MGYAAPSDLVARFSQASMNQLLPVAGSNPLVFDTGRAQVILDQASNYMDSYIGNRYSLPLTLSPVPAQLVDCCCDIAYYRMYSGRPQNWTQDSRDRYEDAIKWLRDVASGKATLGETAAQESALITTSDIGFAGPPRQFAKDPNQPCNPIQQYLNFPMGPGTG